MFNRLIRLMIFCLALLFAGPAQAAEKTYTNSIGMELLSLGTDSTTEQDIRESGTKTPSPQKLSQELVDRPVKYRGYEIGTILDDTIVQGEEIVQYTHPTQIGRILTKSVAVPWLKKRDVKLETNVDAYVSMVVDKKIADKTAEKGSTVIDDSTYKAINFVINNINKINKDSPKVYVFRLEESGDSGLSVYITADTKRIIGIRHWFHFNENNINMLATLTSVYGQPETYRAPNSGSESYQWNFFGKYIVFIPYLRVYATLFMVDSAGESIVQDMLEKSADALVQEEINKQQNFRGQFE